MKKFGLTSLLLCTCLTTVVWAQNLRIAMESRLGNLDPILSAAHQTRDHGYLIYDTLFSLDASGKPAPQMVDSYSVSEDGKTYRFTLRDGLAFHDGTGVTTADVMASIRRWGERDRAGMAIMGIVDNIAAVDDKTFVIQFKIASDVVIDVFAKPSGVPLFIMPAAVAKTPVTEAITNYVGSGPFRFVEAEYVPGVKSVYLKNDAYMPRKEAPNGLAGGKTVNVDRIERIEIADALTAVNSLNEGEIDFVQAVPLDLAPLVKDNPSVGSGYLDGLGYQYGYRMNFLQPPFNNKLVRLAALHAIGQREIQQAQYGDAENHSVCGAVFGCGTTYESDVMAEVAIEADPEKAKELLAEAGYNGELVRILHVTDIAPQAAAAPVMAQQLRAAGFNVELQAMDFMTMLSRRASKEPVQNGGWSIFITGWQVNEVSDPLRSFMILANGRDGYFGWGDVPAIQELTDAFLVERDLQKRKEIAAKIQRVVYEEGIYAPLGQSSRLSAWSSKVEGLVPGGPSVFWNVSKSAD